MSSTMTNVCNSQSGGRNNQVWPALIICAIRGPGLMLGDMDLSRLQVA